MYEQMKWLEQNDDQLRKLMLREPRGYPPLCCNLISSTEGIRILRERARLSVHLDAVLDVPELGKVIVDVAWEACSTSSLT